MRLFIQTKSAKTHQVTDSVPPARWHVLKPEYLTMSKFQPIESLGKPHPTGFIYGLKETTFPTKLLKCSSYLVIDVLLRGGSLRFSHNFLLVPCPRPNGATLQRAALPGVFVSVAVVVVVVSGDVFVMRLPASAGTV